VDRAVLEQYFPTDYNFFQVLSSAQRILEHFLGKKGKMSSSLIVTIEFKQVPGESEAR
jgi:hypothetical protein